MDYNVIVRSKTWNRVALGFGIGAAIALLIGGTLQKLNPNPGSNPKILHGVTGTVISISAPNFSLIDDTQKIFFVSTSSSTVFRLDQQNLHISDLNIHEQVLVLGVTNSDGTLAATLVRVFP